MPRKRPRTTGKGADQQSYSREVLQQALDDVSNGNRTQREAAVFHGIPRTTLRHYPNGTRGKGIVSENGCGGGGSLALPREYEQQLSNCLIVLEKWGFGLSRNDVMDMVQTFVKQNDIKTRFKNGRPGPDWFIGFKQRNNLSIKKPQGVEYVRMSQVNPFVINGFFDLLEKTVKENDFTDKPHLIFNCDETSFSHDPSKTKVVGAKGLSCTRTISSAGRENTTVLMAASAAGDKLPMLCVFKGKNIMESWIDSTSDSRTAFAASKSGWMDSEIFKNWFEKVFLPNIPEERPVMLILDGHGSHISLPLIESAINNEVILVKLPPHTTHVLQPLDVGVFKSLKTSWDKQLTKWQRDNPRKKIPKQEFVNILGEVYQALSPNNIRNGFKATGIFEEGRGPNRDVVIANCNFKPSELQAYKINKLRKADLAQAQPNVEARNEVAIDDLSSDLTIDRTNNEVAHDEATNAIVINDNYNEVVLDEATNAVVINDTYNEVVIDEATNEVAIENTNTNEIINMSKNQVPVTKSFEDIIIDIFHKSKTTPESTLKRKRVSNGAEIMTSKEYVKKKREEKDLEEKLLEEKTRKYEERLKKKEQQHLNKENKSKDKKQVHKGKNNKEKTKLLKKKLPLTQLSPAPSTSKKTPTFRPNNDKSDSCSSDEDSDCSLHDCESDNVLPSITVVKDDFVIVYYNNLKFPGQVLEVINDEVKIKHMKSAGLYWRWPEVDDILSYEEEEIVKIIRPPILMNKRGIYSVPELKGCLFEYE